MPKSLHAAGAPEAARVERWTLDVTPRGEMQGEKGFGRVSRLSVATVLGGGSFWVEGFSVGEHGVEPLTATKAMLLKLLIGSVIRLKFAAD